MEDRFKVGAGGVIVKDDRAKRFAIQSAVAIKDRLAETLDDGGERSTPGGDDVARDAVGVDDGGTPLTKPAGDGRFSGGDAAGQSGDAQLTQRCAPRRRACS